MRKLLEQVGIEPERVEMYNLSAAMGQRFAEIATEMTERVRRLGPSPVKAGNQRKDERKDDLEEKKEVEAA